MDHVDVALVYSETQITCNITSHARVSSRVSGKGTDHFHCVYMFVWSCLEEAQLYIEPHHSLKVAFVAFNTTQLPEGCIGR